MYWIYVFIFGIYNVNTYVYKFIFIILQFWKISHNLYLYYVTKPFGHGILDTPYQLLWLIKTSSIWRKFIFEGRFISKRMIFYIKKIYLHFCCLDTFLLSSQKILFCFSISFLKTNYCTLLQAKCSGTKVCSSVRLFVCEAWVLHVRTINRCGSCGRKCCLWHEELTEGQNYIQGRSEGRGRFWRCFASKDAIAYYCIILLCFFNCGAFVVSIWIKLWKKGS